MSISLTLPIEYNALTRASKMLRDLATDINMDDEDSDVLEESPIEASIPASEGGIKPAEPPQVSSVELDSDGLPWDARIHTGSKLKLKKSEQWKKIRNVSPELVATVEAELRAALAASPESPITPTEEPAAAPPPPTESGIDPATVTNFPLLMTAITSEGIDDVAVLAAVNKVGLTALPLLPTRPDLIPTVAAELFGS